MNKKRWKEVLGGLLLMFLVLPSFAYSPPKSMQFHCQTTCSESINWLKQNRNKKISPENIAAILYQKRQNKLNTAVAKETTSINETLSSQVVLKHNQALSTPDKVKGIYVTGYTFANEKKMAEIVELINTTELNAIVIDIQDDAGNWMFAPSEKILQVVPESKYTLPYQEFQKKLADLQAKNIYTIARVVTFQSPEAKKYYPTQALKHKNGNLWQNWKGISWLDMTNPEAWKIPVAKAKDAIKVGFDEVQFDYIRFPSDGMISQIAYLNPPEKNKKYETMNQFFEYLTAEIDPYQVPISADIFGFTYIRAQAENDLNIGQRVIDFAKYFDHISPMVYPSHYPDGFLGIDKPALEPFIIVNIASRDGHDLINRVENPRAQSRPWLQYFNLGGVYDRAKIQAQIKAVEAYPNSGWIFWNPRNQYEANYFER